ncbi:MAG: type VI secretion system protein ImpL [Desulfobacteraceae bacterium]|nr:type VI secretion system protein ImpL [Desulfobacteraceae bacterium]
MKKLLSTVFKAFLILMVLMLAVLVVLGLVLWAGWSWWAGCFILIGLAGFALGFWLFRKIWARRREQKFVHEIIEQDETARQRLTPKEQDSARQVQARWKEAIDALRGSQLRKYGNPLYVLPWYMVIGQSGSGKTTAITSANLSSPFAEVSRTSGISGTRNCDWWFFEQAVIIDTAGRYAIPVDEGRDKDEWQHFLGLLAKFRKKEPLNGLVVTVAADRLTQHKPEELQEDGRSIRLRVEELMRVLGAKFPVYIMVTKCDLVQGASEFCSALPEDAVNQAMGELNQQLSANTAQLPDKSFRHVGDRLRDLRLILLNQNKDSKAAGSMLLFPEEFERLKEPLTSFIEGVFQESPYMETPLLRGIFFSSGKQEGTPFSHFLNELGLIRGQEVLQETSKGLFLHDFFAKILPTDRNLFRPTQHMHQWRRLTRNLGLTAWIAVMVAVCGLLSYAFVKNLKALSDVRREFRQPAVLQGDLMADIITMERFRSALIEVEEQNRGWWIPRLGLGESVKVEKELKNKYIRLFGSGFLNNFDKQLGERMTRFSVQTPNQEFGAHVMHIARRINLLKNRLSKHELEQLGSSSQPAYSSGLLASGSLIPEMQEKLTTQYLYAVAWQTDGTALNEELKHLQTWLKHLMSLPGASLNWLTDWANNDSGAVAVGLHDFWGGDLVQDKITVAPAYTKAGKTKIDNAIGEIESALFDPLIIAGQKVDFVKWYQGAYYAAWEAFTGQFHEGEHYLAKREQWRTIVKRIPKTDGPYYALVHRVADEFEPFDQKDGWLPDWVGLVYDWQTVNEEAVAEKTSNLQNAGIIKKATKKVTSNLKKAERAFGVKVRTPLDTQARLKAVKAQMEYQQALTDTIKGADSRNVAFKLASDLYQQDPATGESPVLVAHRSLEHLRTILADTQNDKEKVFWNLLKGNIGFLHRYINREAACYLQQRWEKDVLMELQGISSDKDMAKVMMGSQGYANTFINGLGAPFINKSLSKGYHSKKTLDLDIAFHKEFFAYLSKGARAAKPTRANYSVKIRAYPTDTNPEAQLKPHSTVLEMQCADSKTRLENFNYPVAETFNWSVQGCRDVQFQIEVGNLILTKNYLGHNAFAKFLNDFKTGQRIFYRKEFPSEEAALRRIGIRYIKAKYQFQGHRPVLGLLYAAPGEPPQKIAPCWDR